MKKLVILTGISLLTSVGIWMYQSHSSRQMDLPKTTTPEEYRRPADQTFLTYPEWFLVYSPEEFATFTVDNPPHKFPFFGHISQFWHAYKNVYGEIRGKYPFNIGYHVMIFVIGASTTIEYALRSCYENVIGRLSSISGGGIFTEEDIYAAKVAREYVDFINIRPWYEFNFRDRLTKLWTENPAAGKNMIRKWERRYALTTEYGAKAIYGWLIGLGTKASYGEAIPMTSVLLDRPWQSSKSSPGISSTANPDLVVVPRYAAFKDAAIRLANDGYDFREVAGNGGDILVTCLVPIHHSNTEGTRILFKQQILTQSRHQRIAFVVPVNALAKFLRKSVSASEVEHIYDY